jgi:hypothetical protein
MRLLIAASLLLALETPALAAPAVIAVEIEHQDFEMIGFSEQLPMSEDEPGGFLVPKDADRKWFRIGLKPGDVIVTEDSRPVSEMLLIADGITVLGILRKGKPMILHLTVYPEPTQAFELDDDAIKRMQSMTPPFAIPVRDKHGSVSGVRVIDILIATFAKIPVGDIVRSINGKPVRSESELITALRNLPVIGSTTIIVERLKRPVTITLTRTTKTP